MQRRGENVASAFGDVVSDVDFFTNKLLEDARSSSPASKEGLIHADLVSAGWAFPRPRKTLSLPPAAWPPFAGTAVSRVFSRPRRPQRRPHPAGRRRRARRTRGHSGGGDRQRQPPRVSNAQLAATDRIELSKKTAGGTAGAVYVNARTNGTSFTVASTSGTDTATYFYELVR